VHPPDQISCSISPSFANWISQANGSLAVTTYQAGKVVLIGWDPKLNQVTLLPRDFDKPMGLARTVNAKRLALATRHSVVLLADAPLLAQDYLEDQKGKYGALYLPRAEYFTGDLNIHDLGFDAHKHLWLVNTRFSCLSRLSDEHSFLPDCKPPFISEIVPEDRCHLNGLAMVNGRPKYVTCLGESNTVGGWRDNKASGGILIDIESNEIVLRGLSMPHSPRWHDKKLYLLNSGAGELWSFDPQSKSHQIICQLPGYLRGLSFTGNFALVGLCQIREKHIFGGLPVQQREKKLLCGVAIIDLNTNQQVAFFEFTAGVQELYEVLFLSEMHRPMILNREREATREAFTAPAFSYWLRPSSEILPSSPPPGR
jgi:uncharacterized protein (TIGR03032 family)